MLDQITARTHKRQRPPQGRALSFYEAPGDDLLSHGLSHTTIGAAAFHFRVRDGIGWFHSANFTRETVGASPSKERMRRLSRIVTCDVACIWYLPTLSLGPRQLEVIWSS